MPQRSLYVHYALFLLVVVVGLSLLTFVQPTGFATFQTTSESDFSQGTYSGTQYSAADSAVRLTAGTTSGQYTSKVFTASSSAQWRNITWTAGGPYGIELPNNGASESGPGGMSMSGDILLLHMNEQSGQITDSSGSGNHGVNSGATYGAAGKFSTALDFALGNVVTVNGASFYLPTQFTIMGWIKGDTIATDGIHALASRTHADNHRDWFLAVGSETPTGSGGTNAIVQMQVSGDCIKLTRIGGNTLIQTNRWYHIASTYDGSTQQAKVYLNGVDDTNPASLTNGPIPTSLCNSQNNVGIGRRADNAAHALDGSLDEVAIFNRALSASEIQNAYKRGVLGLTIDVRSCDDAACSGETFSGAYKASPATLAVPNNQYFQYRTSLTAEDTTVTPTLGAVTINYDETGAPPADTTPPAVSVSVPSNGTTTTDTTPEVRFTVSDNADSTLDYKVYVGTSISGQGTAANNVLTALNLSLSTGTYALRVEARDDGGNAVNSTPVTLTILPTVTNGPTATIITPSTTTTDTTPEITFIMTHSTDSLLNYRIYANTGVASQGSASQNVSTSVNLSLAAGTYSIIAEATDSAGLAANSTPITLTIIVSDVPPDDTLPEEQPSEEETTQPPACAAFTKQCLGGNVQTCINEQWITTDLCDNGCFEGQCREQVEITEPSGETVTEPQQPLVDTQLLVIIVIVLIAAIAVLMFIKFRSRKSRQSNFYSQIKQKYGL